MWKKNWLLKLNPSGFPLSKNAVFLKTLSKCHLNTRDPWPPKLRKNTLFKICLTISYPLSKSFFQAILQYKRSHGAGYYSKASCWGLEALNQNSQVFFTFTRHDPTFKFILANSTTHFFTPQIDQHSLINIKLQVETANCRFGEAENHLR